MKIVIFVAVNRHVQGSLIICLKTDVDGEILTERKMPKMSQCNYHSLFKLSDDCWDYSVRVLRGLSGYNTETTLVYVMYLWRAPCMIKSRFVDLKKP